MKFTMQSGLVNSLLFEIHVPLTFKVLILHGIVMKLISDKRSCLSFLTTYVGLRCEKSAVNVNKYYNIDCQTQMLDTGFII